MARICGRCGNTMTEWVKLFEGPHRPECEAFKEYEWQKQRFGGTTPYPEMPPLPDVGHEYV